MKSLPVIRSATERDLPCIAEGMVRVQNLHANALPLIYRRFTHDEAVLYLTEVLPKPDVAIRVATTAQRICGHYILTCESKPESMFAHARRFGHLNQIEVDPGHRRRGIGSQLLLDAENLAASLGVDRIVLDVWAFNATAREAFDSSGYVPLGAKLVRHIPDTRDA